jgi:hypothetical protein
MKLENRPGPYGAVEPVKKQLDHLQIPATLHLREEFWILIGQETLCASELLWRLWQRGSSQLPARIELNSPIIQPVDIHLY